MTIRDLAARGGTVRQCPAPRARSAAAFARLAYCGFFACTLLLAWSGDAWSAARFAVANGNWNATSTWSATSGGAAGASIPVVGDDVTIGETATARTVTIPAGYAAAASSVVLATTAGVNGAKALTLAASTSSLTVSGDLTVNKPGANTLTNALNVNAGTVTVNGTATLGGTTPIPSRIAAIVITTGTLTIGGDLVFVAGATASNLINLSSSSGTINLAGAFTATVGTISNPGTSIFNYNGTNAQSVLIGVSSINYPNLHLNNTSATGATLSAAISATSVTGNLRVQSGILNNGGFAIVGAAANTFEVADGARFNLTGTSAMASGFGTRTFAPTSTVNFQGGTQTVASGLTYGNLILSGAGVSTKTPEAGTITIAGDFTLGASTTYAGTTNNPSMNLEGNFSNSGTFTSGTGAYTFTGGSAQTLGGTSATTFTSLAINKSTNDVAIACGTPSPTVNATLTLTSRNIITSGTSPGCSTACASQVPVIVGTTGTIAGGSSSSYVRGALRKLFAAAATLNFRATAGQDEFPVGDASSYTPVEITTGGTSTAGNVTVCVTAAEHPQVTTPPVATGGIDAAKSVNRYWSLSTSTINTASGAGAVLVDATFKFVAGDVDAGASTSNFVLEEWDGAIWSPTTLVSAAATSTRAQNIDLSAATNDIAIGEPLSGITALPGNFNAFDTSTPAGAVLGMIQTKQSGVAFSVRLVRLNAAKNALDTTYTQAGVTVELLDSSDNSGALSGATACRPVGAGAGQWRVIAGTSQTVAFTAGIVATVSFTVANSFRDVRVHVVKTGAGAGEGCSTDRFAIRPQSLTVAAFDGTWETAGTARALANTSASGGIVHKASTSAAATPRPFTLRATPVPAGATNYDGNPSIVSGFPSCTGLGALCTTAGTLSFTAGSWTSAGSGVRDNATAHYSEAGSFNLLLEDTGYASVDAVDGTLIGTRTVPATATVQVGRFVPDHFIVAPNNTPQFQAFGSVCAARSFTYVGQPFGYATAPEALVTARNAGGGTTTNYGGSLWKITTAAPSDVTQTYSNGGVGPALDTSLAINAPTVTPLNNGTGTVTVSSADRLFYTRSTATPQTQFNASIALTLSVRDDSEADGQIVTATATPFSGMAFDSGSLFRYGRLRLANSNGSQLITLPIPMQTQYWNGTAFLTNTLDNCTTITVANITLGNYQRSLAPGDTTPTVGGAFVAGIGTLRLSAPGPAKLGSVDVTANLSGANMTYLQGAWSGPSYTNNPTARATFGLYRSADPVVYQRENF